MDYFTALLIGVGLSADAFAVAVARSITNRCAQAKPAREGDTTTKKTTKKIAGRTSGLIQPELVQPLAIALAFGLFQAIMPIIGWFVGAQFVGIISGVDHWIAFALLLFVGARMIHESVSLRKEEENADMELGWMDGKTILLLSIATSIDAFAVGLGLSFIEPDIIMPAMVIGIVTFVLSLAGCLLGRKFGHLFEDKAELAGGLILILIGLKILFEHIL